MIVQVWFFELLVGTGKMGHWEMESQFELIKYKVNRIILQGRVVKLLDLFRLNEMNKREKRGKSTKQRSS
jgi:hypothetical protein